MDSAIKNLENDHVYILRLIEIMEIIAKTPKPSIDDLETITGIIKNYADGVHHQKEENLLFPSLGEKGFSPQQGPVAVMLQEHTLGRNFVKGLTDAIVLYKTGNENAIQEIRANVSGYISLLRNHIGKENNILFPMANRVLSEQDNQILLTEFVKVENKILEDCISEIEKLEESYKH
jgi:hemerythrin-like domain-containing protein